MSPNREASEFDESGVIPRLSRRGGAFLAFGTVAAAVVVAAVGFLAAPEPSDSTGSETGGLSTQSGQLGTLPLHDEKSMRAIGKAIGKGVKGSTSPTPSMTPIPTVTP